jgi:hypothetical protein
MPGPNLPRSGNHLVDAEDDAQAAEELIDGREDDWENYWEPEGGNDVN